MTTCICRFKRLQWTTFHHQTPVSAGLNGYQNSMTTGICRFKRLQWQQSTIKLNDHVYLQVNSCYVKERSYSGQHWKTQRVTNSYNLTTPTCLCTGGCLYCLLTSLHAMRLAARLSTLQRILWLLITTVTK